MDTSVLKTQADAVRTQLTAMQEQFETLRTVMSGTASYWTGEAAEAHRNAYTSQLDSIDAMLTRYEAYVTDLEIMAGVYETVEAAVQSAAESLPAVTL
ncbi:MAG: hypothetical protein LUG44_07805 [Clostridiales bacterium]|nr:hypothetical protein [Clostridiales bacterium]